MTATRRVVLERTQRLIVWASDVDEAFALAALKMKKYPDLAEPDGPWRIVSAEPPFPDHPEDQK